LDIRERRNGEVVANVPKILFFRGKNPSLRQNGHSQVPQRETGDLSASKKVSTARIETSPCCVQFGCLIVTSANGVPMFCETITSNAWARRAT
jgi:hypothetical protein